MWDWLQASNDCNSFDSLNPAALPGRHHHLQDHYQHQHHQPLQPDRTSSHGELSYRPEAFPVGSSPIHSPAHSPNRSHFVPEHVAGAGSSFSGTTVGPTIRRIGGSSTTDVSTPTNHSCWWPSPDQQQPSSSRSARSSPSTTTPSKGHSYPSTNSPAVSTPSTRNAAGGNSILSNLTGAPTRTPNLRRCWGIAVLSLAAAVALLVLWPATLVTLSRTPSLSLWEEPSLGQHTSSVVDARGNAGGSTTSTIGTTLERWVLPHGEGSTPPRQQHPPATTTPSVSIAQQQPASGSLPAGAFLTEPAAASPPSQAEGWGSVRVPPLTPSGETPPPSIRIIRNQDGTVTGTTSGAGGTPGAAQKSTPADNHPGKPPGAAGSSTCICPKDHQSGSSREGAAAVAGEQGTAVLHLPPQLQYIPQERLYTLFNTSTPGSKYYNIGVWRHTKQAGSQRLVYQHEGGLIGDMRLFVRPGLGQLMLGAARWVLAGAHLPVDAVALAASGEQGRRQLLSLLSSAHRLGLNTVRVMAFRDGHTLCHAIQVAPGILDEEVMREGLDWIVAQVRHFGLRILLVLTSARYMELGGAAQYVRWYKAAGGTITEFYRDDTYKARFFDYITALAVRVNVHTGITYAADPAILGWDIIDGALDPGPKEGGDDLQGWLPYISNFLRSKDPNHLVLASSDGLFGPSSPHHLHLNPPPQLRLPPWLLLPPHASLPPLPSAPACEGADFLRNGMLRELDVVVVSILPDAWLSCSDDCKLAWARDWVAAHVRDALRMQKPLLIGQMAMHGPPHRQRALHQVVLGYLASVGKQGMPVAGAFLVTPIPGCPEGDRSSGASYASFTNGSCYKGLWGLEVEKAAVPPTQGPARRPQQAALSPPTQPARPVASPPLQKTPTTLNTPAASTTQDASDEDELAAPPDTYTDDDDEDGSEALTLAKELHDQWGSTSSPTDAAPKSNMKGSTTAGNTGGSATGQPASHAQLDAWRLQWAGASSNPASLLESFWGTPPRRLQQQDTRNFLEHLKQQVASSFWTRLRGSSSTAAQHTQMTTPLGASASLTPGTQGEAGAPAGSTGANGSGLKTTQYVASSSSTGSSGSTAATTKPCPCPPQPDPRDLAAQHAAAWRLHMHSFLRGDDLVACLEAQASKALDEGIKADGQEAVAEASHTSSAQDGHSLTLGGSDSEGVVGAGSQKAGSTHASIRSTSKDINGVASGNGASIADVTGNSEWMYSGRSSSVTVEKSRPPPQLPHVKGSEQTTAPTLRQEPGRQEPNPRSEDSMPASAAGGVSDAQVQHGLALTPDTGGWDFLGQGSKQRDQLPPSVRASVARSESDLTRLTEDLLTGGWS